MDAEAKARARAQELCAAAEQFRRTGGIIERKETIKALPDEVVQRISDLEDKHVQAMHALQTLLQLFEDERARRVRLEQQIIKLADGADAILRRVG